VVSDSNELSEPVCLVVDTAADARLDAYLAQRLPALSRSQIVNLISAGHVTLNGRAARKSEKPAAGDVIEIQIPEAEPSTLEPENIPLDIRYEDADLLVIDKPAGLVVHPGPGNQTGTLVHALLHHVKDLSGIGGVLRPGIVHRLDKETSGLMLVAKHDQAHRALSAALRRREVKRLYMAAAWGHFTQDHITVDAPIARSPNFRQRMAIVAGGRPAVTHFTRLERWRGADLLRAELETGRTHQIRVHLLSIGHPVVGDLVYAPRAAKGMSGPAQGWSNALARRVHRQFLHAYQLEFAHPTTGVRVRFDSPLPPDLLAAVEWARSTS